MASISTMSTTTIGLSDPERILKRSSHWRKDSGELDVFEAEQYFSGYNEAAAVTQRSGRSGRRISLDMTMRSHLTQQIPTTHSIENQHKDKKHKEPSSPGGRLASFLNSLFNQTRSRKKKSKSSMKDEEESPGGRRRRRSSISHFRSSRGMDTKSIFSSSTSGFRTPPPCAQTPKKSYRDFGNHSGYKQVVTITKNTDLSWLDEKLKLTDSKSRCPQEKKDATKFSEVDDGAESDSSSDLFELQNYDLGIYSSGLPVYETTCMDSIKRGVPISTCAL